MNVSVRNFGRDLVVIEEVVEVVESRAPVRVLVPTVKHYLVQLVGARGRLGHSVPGLYPLDHLAVVHPCTQIRLMV